jgi:two-component system response regulator
MQKLFILVAEDDSDDRFLLEAAFLEKGYKDKIEFVENGVELIDFLSNIHNKTTTHESFPYFILLDLNMPKKDGREVLKEIKQHPVFKKIPIVVFTTTRNESEIKRCYELGANTYVVKPVSFEGLLKVLDDIRGYWFNTAAIAW